MDRILIIMDAPEFVNARSAVISARKNASHPEALSFGFTLQEEPVGKSFDELNSLTAVWLPFADADPWTVMEECWMGEDYVLMSHPAMRFTPGWDVRLLRTLHQCRSGQLTTSALTGFLPMQSDPLGEVCPVAAEAFLEDGSLTFRHGMPVRHMDKPPRSPFLHPSFCFAPAGFFRAVAKGDEPLFLRAFRAGWDIYTLHKPILRMQWSVPVPSVQVPLSHDLIAAFDERFGVSFASRMLSTQACRGLMTTELTKPKHYPLQLCVREWWRKVTYKLGHLLPRHAKQVSAHCVTLVTDDMGDEAMLWFRQLASLTNIPMTAYVSPSLKRQVLDLVPDTYDLRPQHVMEIPGQSMEAVRSLSKAALLAAARDRLLSPSHYIWMSPDCIRYPVYEKAFLEWEPVCRDTVFMAMVNGEPDVSMFSVPQSRVHDLARDLLARTLTILEQHGSLPEESELWNIVIRENPDWFTFINLPARGLLFTMVCDA